MKTVKFNPLHPSSAHLQGIHFLLAAKNVWKMNPNRDDMMRYEWRIKGIPIMLLQLHPRPHSQRAMLGFEIIFCSVCICEWKSNSPGLGFEMQKCLPWNWQSKRVPRQCFRVSKGRSDAIWVSAAIWYWYRISDDKELTHCALYHEQKPPAAWARSGIRAVKPMDQNMNKSGGGECVYGNIKVLNHQKALEYDLCSNVPYKW